MHVHLATSVHERRSGQRLTGPLAAWQDACAASLHGRTCGCGQVRAVLPAQAGVRQRQHIGAQVELEKAEQGLHAVLCHQLAGEARHGHDAQHANARVRGARDALEPAALLLQRAWRRLRRRPPACQSPGTNYCMKPALYCAWSGGLAYHARLSSCTSARAWQRGASPPGPPAAGRRRSAGPSSRPG